MFLEKLENKPLRFCQVDENVLNEKLTILSALRFGCKVPNIIFKPGDVERTLGFESVSSPAEFLQNFRELFNFFITILLKEKSDVGMTTAREAMFVMMESYQVLEEQAVRLGMYEAATVVHECSEVFRVIYRFLTERSFSLALYRHTDRGIGLEKSGLWLYRAAKRLLIIYEARPQKPLSRAETMQILEEERVQLFDYLETTGVTSLPGVDATRHAEHNNWLGSAATIFLTKTNQLGELQGIQKKPISLMFDLARSGIQFTEKPIQFSPQPEGRNNLYTVAPEITSPLSRLKFKMGDRENKYSLQFTDLFILFNAATHLYTSVYSRDIHPHRSSIDSIPNKDRLVSYVYRLLELEFFCAYSMLAHEFSFSHLAEVTEVLVKALLLRATGRRNCVSLGGFIEPVLQLVREIEGQPDFITTNLRDKSLLDRETAHFTKVRENTSKILRMSAE